MRVNGYTQIPRVEQQPIQPANAVDAKAGDKPVRKDQYTAQQEQADKLLRMLEPKGRIIDIRV